MAQKGSSNSDRAGKKAKRSRQTRPYPASSFEDALVLGRAVMTHAAGEKVRRLTLLEQINKSPNSSATRQMFSNSGKYGITKGSYAAEFLELTPNGRKVVDSKAQPREQRQAAFALAIGGVQPFSLLYDHYQDKRLPERAVMKDVLKDSPVEVPDLDECVDTFIVNAKDLDLLRTIGGAETVVSIEQVIEEISGEQPSSAADKSEAPSPSVVTLGEATDAIDWKKTCFYITPIGAEDSEERRHADLFTSSLVQPALEEMGLELVRADKIAEPGMITSQVLEYLKKSRLAIADLSYLNPNVFYEVALRHALRLPVVQIIRKADKLPFDVNQTRTLVFDTTDIYSLVPKLQTYRAQIASQSRKALDDPESVGNPVMVFYPQFYN